MEKGKKKEEEVKEECNKGRNVMIPWFFHRRALSIMKEVQGGAASELLLKIYNEDTVKEWMDDKLENNLKLLQSKKNKLEDLLKHAQV